MGLRGLELRLQRVDVLLAAGLHRGFDARLEQLAPRLRFHLLERTPLLLCLEDRPRLSDQPLERPRRLLEGRALHDAGAPDRCTPEVGHHGPVVLSLRPDRELAPDVRSWSDSTGRR